ncbi:hypothetical protein ACLOJK_024011 [Asimina triloba]
MTANGQPAIITPGPTSPNSSDRPPGDSNDQDRRAIVPSTASRTQLQPPSSSSGSPLQSHATKPAHPIKVGHIQNPKFQKTHLIESANRNREQSAWYNTHRQAILIRNSILRNPLRAG